jgi:hypothetical protein
MVDPEVRDRKIAVLLAAILGAGLVAAGFVIKIRDSVVAPQRHGGSTTLTGESAQEYAVFPFILGGLLLIGSLVYWWTEIRPLLDD